jgi:predicted permease
MDAVAGQLAQQFPTSNAGWTVNIRSITDVVVGAPFRRALLVLSAVVAFVLLIACANAANMQLARAAARRKEIALRRALGASRGRVAAQLLLESTFLGIVAGVAGLALAFAGVALLRHVGEATVPRLEDVRLDAPVVVFTIIVALTSGLLFGWLPALGATRADIGTVLKEGGRTSHGAAGERLRGSLVVAEITLSLVLLIGAGLILRSFARLQSVDIGFEPRGVYLASIRLPESSYADIGRATRFFDDLLARARSLPGVTDAAEVSSAPFAGPNTGLAFLPVGHPFDPGQPPPDADYRVITPGYLRVMGIRLVRGRDFSSLDVGGAPVVIVSETLARRQWPNDDPIGKRLRVGDVLRGPEATVIGVAGDARYMSLEDAEVRQMMYLSAGRSPQRSMSLVVRGGNLASLAPAVGRIMAQLDPSLPAPTVRELDEVVGLAMATRRFALVLLGAFAGSALVLTALGLYGVIAYLVRQRTHELGLRIALGATGRAVIRMVLGRAMRLTFFGVVLGLLGAWALTRWLGALLFEVQPTDPATFAAIVALLVVVATLASLVPARRAARADPMLALRGE